MAPRDPKKRDQVAQWDIPGFPTRTPNLLCLSAPPLSGHPELSQYSLGTALLPPFLCCACSCLNGMLSPAHLQGPQACPPSQSSAPSAQRGLTALQGSQTTQSSKFQSKLTIHCPLNCLACTSFLLCRRESPKGQQGPWPLLASTCQAAPSTGPCSLWVLRKHLRIELKTFSQAVSSPSCRMPAVRAAGRSQMHIHLRSLGRPALKGLLDRVKPRGCQGMNLLLLLLVRVLTLLGSPCPASRGAALFRGGAPWGVVREVWRSPVQSV